MGRTKQRNHHAKTGRVGALVGTLLIVVAALCIFLYRDKFAGGTAASQTSAGNETYTYETGSQQMFSLMGNELAIASTTGLQLLDGSGKSILREVFSMTKPAVCTSDKCCVFYDIGGTAIRVVKSGKSSTIAREAPVTSVSLSSGGYIAVSGEEDGYKGSVIVYDEALKPIYKWYSGSAYPLDAAVSPENDELAVLTVGENGSEIHLFRLDSEKETSTVKLDGELAFRLHYAKNGDFCVLSEKNLRFYAPGGKALSTFAFSSGTLDNYAFGTDFTVVALGKYVSGGSTELTSLGPDGKKLGNMTLSEAPTALSLQGRKLLVLAGDAATVYDNALRAQKSAEVNSGYLSAALLPNGEVLLLSTHYAEKCTPKGD